MEEDDYGTDPVVLEYIRVYAAVALRWHETPRWRFVARAMLKAEIRRIEAHRAVYEFRKLATLQARAG